MKRPNILEVSRTRGQCLFLRIGADVFVAQTSHESETITMGDVQALKDAIAAQQLRIQRLTDQIQLEQQWQEIEVPGSRLKLRRQQRISESKPPVNCC
jgi:prefoldin subunit 5